MGPCRYGALFAINNYGLDQVPIMSSKLSFFLSRRVIPIEYFPTLAAFVGRLIRAMVSIVIISHPTEITNPLCGLRHGLVYRIWWSDDSEADLAFAVANFIQKGGSFVNYYMYHGGTNFGSSVGGPFITTSYDYDAPLDEYGLIRQPKYGHLKGLHKVVKKCEKALVSPDTIVTSLGPLQQAHVYDAGSTNCAAFLSNYDT
ncbi:hypothetical protein OROMI_013322 [Orobanche minor]